MFAERQLFHPAGLLADASCPPPLCTRAVFGLCGECEPTPSCANSEIVACSNAGQAASLNVTGGTEADRQTDRRTKTFPV